MKNFAMPSLGADMEEGTFVEWLVKPGQHVKRGDVVCVVETQKGAVDVEIWDTGDLTELVAQPGDVIPVGGTMATIAVEGEAESGTGVEKIAVPGAPAAPARPAAAAASPASSPHAAPAATAAAPAAADTEQRLRISPAARKRAQELGIDVATVKPAAPGQPIDVDDVERAAQKPAAASSATTPPADKADKRGAMRAAIAAAMTRSKRDIPHYYLGTRICVERAASWLEQRNAERPVAERILFAALELKAVALALKALPELNGHYVDGAFRPGGGIHPGVAISLRGGGLVAPAIHDADKLSLADLMARLKDLLGRARGGQLRGSEMSDPTITVTNLGDLGVESVYGVIYPPQVAIVGLGRVALRPWVQEGKVTAARVLNATLAADHRVTDGMRGTRFLSELDRLLQQPEELT